MMGFDSHPILHTHTHTMHHSAVRECLEDKPYHQQHLWYSSVTYDFRVRLVDPSRVKDGDFTLCSPERSDPERISLLRLSFSNLHHAQHWQANSVSARRVFHFKTKAEKVVVDHSAIIYLSSVCRLCTWMSLLCEVPTCRVAWYP